MTQIKQLSPYIILIPYLKNIEELNAAKKDKMFNKKLITIINPSFDNNCVKIRVHLIE